MVVLTLDRAPDALADVLELFAELPCVPADAIGKASGLQATVIRRAADLLLDATPSHPGPVPDPVKEAQLTLRRDGRAERTLALRLRVAAPAQWFSLHSQIGGAVGAGFWPER